MATADELRRFLQLDRELTMVRTTLDHSDDLIGRMKFSSVTGHLLEPLLALGLERLVKVTYGLAVESETGTWPGSDIKKFGHGIHRAHLACADWVKGHVVRATHPSLITSTLTQIELDPVAELILRHLEDYAFNGRFFNLDGLAGGGGEYSPSAEFWSRIDEAALAVGFRSPHTGLNDDQWSAMRNDLLRTSLRRIRTFYFQAWVQGVCGPTAKQNAFSIKGDSPQLY